ncbi:hypothetical protein QFC22_002810 [Naganishia vaughanmartiniae]|uniref:Uncharacterized protein n=1 Tax=Naganishia vaughanmartiniae TaxID=1424756 RepID=A0ACC2XB98_9TREE|nr:hypothetical protein QFC22_002810 [Naganishia vaughanmartiniae]
MAIRLLNVRRYLPHRNNALPSALSAELSPRGDTISCLSGTASHHSIRTITQYTPKKYAPANRTQVKSHPVSIHVNEKEYLDHLHASGEAYRKQENGVQRVKSGQPSRPKYIRRNPKFIQLDDIGPESGDVVADAFEFEAPGITANTCAQEHVIESQSSDPDPSSAEFAGSTSGPTPATLAQSSAAEPTAVADHGLGIRRNAVGVQLLSPKLHKQLFPGKPKSEPSPTITAISLQHLKDNDLSPDGAAVLPEINFDMPPLQGNSIREHFHRIGKDIAEPYLSMSKRFAEGTLPKMPQTWCTSQPGWYRYDKDSGKGVPVEDLGEESLICFDVEVLYKLSPYPVMATAATPNAWYSWLSPAVFDNDPTSTSGIPSALIPIAKSNPEAPRIIVGHNVGYDRSKVLEEYHVKRSGSRWMDTLALHVATKGITSVQRPAWLRRKKEKLQAKEHRTQSQALINEMEGLEEDGEYSTGKDTDAMESPRWEDVTSANALSEVARLHLGLKVDKSIRDEFGNPNITSAAQLQPDLQKLLQYCAKDVDVTHRVLQKILPLFLLSCPHPVSFAGALTMGNPFLPIDKSWKEYIKNADAKYRELEGGVKGVLWELAYKLKQQGRIEGDPWSEQLDWEPKTARWNDDFVYAEQLPSKDGRTEAEIGDGGQSDESQHPKSTPSLSTERSLTQEVSSEDNEPEQRQEGIETETFDNDSTTNPRWLAQGESWLKGQPQINKMGDVLPMVLQVTHKGHPLVESREHRWIIAAPVSQENLAVEHGEPLSFKHPDDFRFAALTDRYEFYRPGGARINSPFAKSRRSDWVAGMYSSPYGDLCTSLVAGSSREQQVDTIRQATQAFLDTGRTTVQGLVMDWQDADFKISRRPRSTVAPKIKSAKRKATAPNGTWPKWFWDLVPGGGNALPPGELELTVRKRVAPLLLRLRWKGYPLFYSREHGWLYRMSEAEALKTAHPPVKFTTFAEGADAKLVNDTEGAYIKIPHAAGGDANVGNPLSKPFLRYVENGVLASAPAEAGRPDNGIAQAAADAMSMNAQCSYWISSRERIIDQMDVYAQDIGTMGFDQTAETAENLGIILPRVISMGTVTRRAVEATWLTASNAKKNRVGSELKAMIRAPSGYTIVGADVDSEELWIASVMGDSQFGMHGATAIGWMTLEGTKATGTDLHSKTAKILNTTRDNAKIFNYSRIYGAGIKHAVQLLKQHNPNLADEEAERLAKNLYTATKGRKANLGRNQKQTLPKNAIKSLWHGGSESYLFNTLESIATSPLPQTPALGCGVTDALKKVYLPENGPFGTDYLPSRINWVVQSSGVDYLHLLIIGMEYLIKKYDISARYMISLHDELRYLVDERDKYRAALALQIVNAWTRALLCYNLGIQDLPQGVTFFSAVDLDRYLRKEVDMTCVTPSQSIPLERGESLDIEGLLKITNGDLGPINPQQAEASDAMEEIELTDVTPPPDLTSALHENYLRVQAGKEGRAAIEYINRYNTRHTTLRSTTHTLTDNKIKRKVVKQ